MAINRVSQMVLLVSAMLGIFPEEIRVLLIKVVDIVAYIVKAIVRLFGVSWQKDGVGFQFPPEAHPDVSDNDIFGNHHVKSQLVTFVVALAVVMIIVFVVTQLVPNPFGILFHISDSWGLIGSGVFAVIDGILFFFISVFLFSLFAFVDIILSVVASYLLIVSAWPLATIMSLGANAISGHIFRGVIAIAALISGLAILFTT